MAERGRAKARGQHVRDNRRDVECKGVGTDVGTSVRLIVPSVCQSESDHCQLAAVSQLPRERVEGASSSCSRATEKSEGAPGGKLVSCFRPGARSDEVDAPSVVGVTGVGGRGWWRVVVGAWGAALLPRVRLSLPCQSWVASKFSWPSPGSTCMLLALARGTGWSLLSGPWLQTAVAGRARLMLPCSLRSP